MDWVELGSYLTIAVSALVVIILGVKGYNLIWKDGDKN